MTGAIYTGHSSGDRNWCVQGNRATTQPCWNPSELLSSKSWRPVPISPCSPVSQTSKTLCQFHLPHYPSMMFRCCATSTQNRLIGKRLPPRALLRARASASRASRPGEPWTSRAPRLLRLKAPAKEAGWSFLRHTTAPGAAQTSGVACGPPGTV